MNLEIAGRKYRFVRRHYAQNGPPGVVYVAGPGGLQLVLPASAPVLVPTSAVRIVHASACLTSGLGNNVLIGSSKIAVFGTNAADSIVLITQKAGYPNSAFIGSNAGSVVDLNEFSFASLDSQEFGNAPLVSWMLEFFWDYNAILADAGRIFASVIWEDYQEILPQR